MIRTNKVLGLLLIITIGTQLTFGDDALVAGKVSDDLPVVFQADFESGSLDGWKFTDDQAWKITEVDGNRVLDQHQRSKYEPAVRSPFNIGLIEGLDLSDFVLDLRLRSTTRNYGHRDLCLFFGHQDPSHFYYVHLGKEADPHAHSVFLVNDEPRVSIAKERTDGTPWSESWHDVRIVRNATEGTIKVYFDDMENPVMEANDTTFTHGAIGFGSFDDTGWFDDIVIRGKVAETPGSDQ